MCFRHPRFADWIIHPALIRLAACTALPALVTARSCYYPLLSLTSARSRPLSSTVRLSTARSRAPSIARSRAPVQSQPLSRACSHLRTTRRSEARPCKPIRRAHASHSLDRALSALICLLALVSARSLLMLTVGLSLSALPTQPSSLLSRPLLIPLHLRDAACLCSVIYCSARTVGAGAPSVMSCTFPPRLHCPCPVLSLQLTGGR